MSEPTLPTLEQIAETRGEGNLLWALTSVETLAREVLAQRRFLEAFTGIGLERPPEEVFAFFRKLHEIEADALERSRPEKDDGNARITYVGLRDLITRAERAERERDEARHCAQFHSVTNQVLIRERDATRVSEARLRETLEKYGGHKASCVRVGVPQLPCDCGYQQALDAKDPA